MFQTKDKLIVRDILSTDKFQHYRVDKELRQFKVPEKLLTKTKSLLLLSEPVGSPVLLVQSNFILEFIFISTTTTQPRLNITEYSQLTCT